MTERRQPAGHPANSTRYKKARAAFMERQGSWGSCWLCGGGVDMNLSGRHKWGPSIDHIIPTSAGADFFDQSNWALAHRSCNAAKGRGGVAVAPPIPNAPPQDRRWCWYRQRDGGWEKASLNGLDCDVPGETCPHDRRRQSE